MSTLRRGRRWVSGAPLCISLSVLLELPAQGAARPSKPRVVKQPLMDLTLRVETAEEAFVVFDAMTPEGTEREEPMYPAYWADLGAAEIFVFDPVLRTRADVVRALLDLSPDFVVDTGAVLAGAERLPDARAAGEARRIRFGTISVSVMRQAHA